MAQYFILADKIEDEYCGIYDRPDDFPKIARPSKGVRMEQLYAQEQKFRMAKEVPGIKIPDLIHNAVHYLMISAKLKKIFEEHSSAEIEFLRFTLLNHKGRIASDECYIANIIGTVDCVDMKRTEGDEDPVNPGRLMRLERLFLLDDKIDPKLNLFRIKPMPWVVIVRDDLRKIMERERVTGATFHEMGAEVDIL